MAKLFQCLFTDNCKGERKLHTGVALCFLGCEIALAVLFTHPLFLGALLFVSLFALWRKRRVSVFFKSLPFLVPIVLLYAAINALFNKMGETLLWRGPRLPVIGHIELHAEALLYGANMALRFVVVTASFAAYNAWVDGDQAFQFFMRFTGKSAVTAILAARLTPLLAEHWRVASDVLRARGAKLDTGSWWMRAKNRAPLLAVLLYSALDGAWQLAEAMETRAFGSGRRTYYRQSHWGIADVIGLAALLLAIGFGAYAIATQIAIFVFFPVMDAFVLDRWTWGTVIPMTVLMLVPFLRSAALGRSTKQHRKRNRSAFDGHCDS